MKNANKSLNPELEQSPEVMSAEEGDVIQLPKITKPATVMRDVSKLARRFGWLTSEKGVNFLIRKGKSVRIDLSIPKDAEGMLQYITPCAIETLYAITSLKERGCDYMTPDQIYAEVYGMKTRPGTHLSAAGVQEIINDIETARHTFCTIRDENGSNIVDGYLISVYGNKKLIKHAGRVTTRGFYIQDIDLLSRAAKEIGNRLPVNRDVLSFENAGLSNTRLGLTIRSYLLLEIHRIKNVASNRESDNLITWDSMLRYEAHPEIVEYLPSGEIKLTQRHGRLVPVLNPPHSADPRGRMLSTRKKIALKWLEYWKEIGFITGYERAQDPSDRRKEIGVIVYTDKTTKALTEMKKQEDLRKFQLRSQASAEEAYPRKVDDRQFENQGVYSSKFGGGIVRKSGGV